MSGHLRQAIGPTRHRLLQLMVTATSPEFTSFVAIDNSLSRTDNIQNMRHHLFDLKTLIERINAATNILEIKNQAWGSTFRLSLVMLEILRKKFTILSPVVQMGSWNLL